MDGDEDIIGLITFTATGHVTSNFSFLVIFTNENGDAEFYTDKDVNAIYADLISVNKNNIVLITTNYSNDDSECCPSLKGKISYVLNGNKLVEK